MISPRILAAFTFAVSLSSCELFKPDQPPADPNQQYGAANAYNANAGGYPAYGANQNPYGQPPAGAPASPYGAGGYAQPNYNQPYTPPPDAGGYSAGGYSSPPAAGNSNAASGRTHTVAGGENLSKIARRYGVSTESLMQANQLTDPNFIRAGQTLTIP